MFALYQPEPPEPRIRSISSCTIRSFKDSLCKINNMFICPSHRDDGQIKVKGFVLTCEARILPMGMFSMRGESSRPEWFLALRMLSACGARLTCWLLGCKAGKHKAGLGLRAAGSGCARAKHGFACFVENINIAYNTMGFVT